MKPRKSYLLGMSASLAVLTAFVASAAAATFVRPDRFSVSHATASVADERGRHDRAQSADIEALRDLKLRQWPKAYREQDATLLDRILDDSFRMTDGSGVISSKAEELAWVRANKSSYDRFRYEIERIDVYGDSAIVAGLGTIEFDEKGGVRIVRYRSTNVLIKRDGRWRAVASHVSMLKEDVSP